MRQNMLRFLAGATLVLACLRANANPIFARATGFKCGACHNGFPRLNGFGLAYKMNNFRIPGTEKTANPTWDRTIPLATQIKPTYMRSSPGHGVNQFTDTQLLAAGILTRTTAFYIHHSLWIDDKTVPFPSYEVWVQQVLNERNKVMIKVGQFELPYIYSPLTNSISAFQPMIYGAGLQSNDVVLGSPMRGLQLSGIADKKLRWYAAAGAPSLLSPGNTVGQKAFFGVFHDVDLRVETLNNMRRVGLFAYFTSMSRSATNPALHDSGRRFGIDGVYETRWATFYGMAVYGENNNPLGNGRLGTLRGAFIEADKMITPKIGIMGRLEAQSIDVGGTHNYSDARTIGVRFYPFPHLRLSAEYQQADHGKSATALVASIPF